MALIIMMTIVFLANMNPVFVNEFITWVVRMIVIADTVVEGVSVGQQDHKSFGFSYQTIIGNDTDNNSHGYKIHLVYGCLAAPSAADYNSVNDSPEAATMSWDISTTPVSVSGFKPTATLVLDSTKLSEKKMAAIEKVLYGDDTENGPRLPLPDEVKSIITAVSE